MQEKSKFVKILSPVLMVRFKFTWSHLATIFMSTSPTPFPGLKSTISIKDGKWFITYASIISSFIPCPPRVQCKEKQKHANRPLSVVGYLYFKNGMCTKK